MKTAIQLDDDKHMWIEKNQSLVPGYYSLNDI